MTLPFLLVFALLLLALLGLIEVGVLADAYARMGVSQEWLVALLVASILGSRTNVPVARLRGRVVTTGRVVRVWGIPYVVPEVRRQGIVVAVNMGGAVIPTALAAYLIARHGLGREAAVAVGVVAVATYLLARPVPGVGIVVPGLAPPLVAALTALLISPGQAPALAYACGTLGTLLGADILNLPRVRRLGAPVVAIGGAGTWDGIFLTGLIAVLIASL